MIKNKLYINQFYLLAFISIITFKVGVLPSLMHESCSKESIIVYLVMMVIELIMLSVVYQITSKTSLLEMNLPKIYKIIFSILIFVSLTIKFMVYFAEGNNYIKNQIFENANHLFIALPLMLTLLYMAYKGVNNIARICEIIFFIIAFALIFNILFANIDFNVEPLKNIKITNNSYKAIDKYILWFGDFTPFLYAHIIPKRKKCTLTLFTILGIVLIPVLLQIGVCCIFEEAAQSVEYAFSKIAVYNQFSFLIGSFDIPTIISFIICSIIKLALMLFAIVDILKYLFNNNKLTIIFIGIYLLGISFVLSNKEKLINFATSYIRYIVFAIEYTVPFAVLVLMRIYKNKTSSVSKIKEAKYA